MANPITRSTIATSGFQQLPAFLAPALARCAPLHFQSHFSTTPTLGKEHRKRNKERGISAMRGTGPKKSLSVRNWVQANKLPQPVLDPTKRSKAESDPDHGLWQFFGKDRQPMMTPEEMAAHGREWSVEELRHKSWEDLHALYWVCIKERNRIATMEYERRRAKAGYGEHEASFRDAVVRKTQRSIKHVLTERWYAYQNAWKLVKEDPEISEQVQGSGTFLEDDVLSKDTPTQQSGPAVIPDETPSEREQPRTT